MLRGRFRLPGRRDFDDGRRRRGDVPFDDALPRGRGIANIARRRGRVGFTQEGARPVDRHGRDLQGDVADLPGGASGATSRCFSCRKSRVLESLIRNPPSPRNSAAESTTGGSPNGRSSSSAGGRSSFSSGPKSRVSAPRFSSGRGSGPEGASLSSRALDSVGAGTSASVSSAGGEDASVSAERTRSKARSTSSFPGSAASAAGEEEPGAAGSAVRDETGKGIRFPTGGG